jgi:hypothetical protein
MEYVQKYNEPSFLFWGYDSIIQRIVCAFTDHIWEYIGPEWHHDSSVSEHFKCTRCGKQGVH